MPTNMADAVLRLKRLISRLRGKRIGVLGDLMLDRYLWGTASRLSPEAAGPVVDFLGQSGGLCGAGDGAPKTAQPWRRGGTFWGFRQKSPRPPLHTKFSSPPPTASNTLPPYENLS